MSFHIPAPIPGSFLPKGSASGLPSFSKRATTKRAVLQVDPLRQGREGSRGSLTPSVRDESFMIGWRVPCEIGLARNIVPPWVGEVLGRHPRFLPFEPVPVKGTRKHIDVTKTVIHFRLRIFIATWSKQMPPSSHQADFPVAFRKSA